MPHLTVHVLEPQITGHENDLIARLTDAVTSVYGEWARNLGYEAARLRQGGHPDDAEQVRERAARGAGDAVALYDLWSEPCLPRNVPGCSARTCRDLRGHHVHELFDGSGMNLLTRRWYARYASPRERSDCASVGGMPVTPKMLARMIACGASATRPHGAYAKPATA